MKYLLFLFISFCFWMSSPAQDTTNRGLFVIDSIPLFEGPEEWNKVMGEDVADMNTIKNPDSIKLLGYDKYEAVTYIFTKAYRSRPDSIRNIPTRKEMVVKNSLWYYKGTLYSGKFIDYYNNGRILGEGILQDGMLNGALKAYFPGGLLSLIIHFENNIRDGDMIEYYENGCVKQQGAFKAGKSVGSYENYFFSGQIESRFKKGNNTKYDTAYSYYSTGKLKQVMLIKNGVAVIEKKKAEIAVLNKAVNEAFAENKFKKATRYALEITALDSLNADAYFNIGIALYRQYLFDRAITALDKALEIEPVMRAAYGYRGLARIKKYQFLNATKTQKENRDTLLSSDQKVVIPNEEHDKICKDLKRAVSYGFNKYYNMEKIQAGMINYCSE